MSITSGLENNSINGQHDLALNDIHDTKTRLAHIEIEITRLSKDRADIKGNLDNIKGKLAILDNDFATTMGHHRDLMAAFIEFMNISFEMILLGLERKQLKEQLGGKEEQHGAKKDLLLVGSKL